MRPRTAYGLVAAAAVILTALSACGGEGDVNPGQGGTDPTGGTGGDAGSGGGTPIPPSPIEIPGIFQAEDFDPGGEAVGYHDKVVGNAGGQYRLDEDVDIIVSGDPSGGDYDVSDFEAGEWLAYTVNVTDTGEYDIAVRAASDSEDSAFHIEIDDQDVTGRIVTPDTGSLSDYEWISANRARLTAGQHLMKIISDKEYINLNAVRVVAPPVSSPYPGAPIAVPGTFEAEDFDLGGEGVAYHDKVAGNAGGQYRLDEDVDIIASDDPSGGLYDISDFETGEWLSYTIDVAETTDLDIALRVASASSDSAFHVEIDGKDVTGSVRVPSTGSSSDYEWVEKKGVPVSAGSHTVTVIADEEYFDLNSLRMTPTHTEGAQLLFKSGFEGLMTLSPLVMYGNGAWQDIAGLDTETGFAWPPLLWGGTTSRFQLIAGDNEQVTSATLGDYMYNEIQTVTGHDDSPTRALYSAVQKSVGGADINWDSTQNDFVIFPGASGQGDFYLSYWLKFQPDLLERMTVESWAGRVITDWKTGVGTGGGGDYRILLSVFGDRANNRLYWNLRGDNVANGDAAPQIFWELNSDKLAVPVGAWFRVETFVHRSSEDDGRVWIAINGQTLFDRYGPNTGVNNLAWNRIMPFLNYSSGQALPAHQWVDDLEIWDGFPSTASPH